jgi:DNA-binding CsgD family transcriptional regulator
MAQLSAHQQAVLELLAQGRSQALIARDLGRSEIAVRATVWRIKQALGASTAAHAVHLAHGAGLLGARRARHGDHAGFARHVRAGERACGACVAGERVYRAGLRRRRGEAA